MPKKKKRKGGKSMIRTAEKLLRMAAFAAPEAGTLMSRGLTEAGIAAALQWKTGYNYRDQSFNLRRLVVGWGPFALASIVPPLIHKAIGIIRKI